MTDVLEMVWVSKMDDTPDLKLEDAIDSETELEDAFKELSIALVKED
jgi:hypothetical protein